MYNVIGEYILKLVVAIMKCWQIGRCQYSINNSNNNNKFCS